MLGDLRHASRYMRLLQCRKGQGLVNRQASELFHLCLQKALLPCNVQLEQQEVGPCQVIMHIHLIWIQLSGSENVTFPCLNDRLPAIHNLRQISSFFGHRLSLLHLS